MITPSDLEVALRRKVAALQAALLAKVEANLSGAILQARSGTLKASLQTSLTETAGVFMASVGSEGVPYAAIQEYSGVTTPHDILPVKAQALALVGVGGTVFTKRVHHPGSHIPARSYLASARDELRAEIVDGVKASVLATLGLGSAS
jgi:phage gpG-like protein